MTQESNTDESFGGHLWKELRSYLLVAPPLHFKSKQAKGAGVLLEVDEKDQGVVENTTVSVIVTTYNRPHLVSETLDSILAQTYANFELIVVSDGENAETAEVVGRYSDPRVRFIQQTHIGLPAATRNRGMVEAQGKYIAFCDDDDIWQETKLQRQLAAFEVQPDAALCYTDEVYFDSHGEWTFAGRVKQVGFSKLFQKNVIPTSSVMIRRDVIDTVGLFNDDRSVVAIEDYEYWLRIACHYDIVFEATRLVWLRQGNPSITKEDKKRIAMEIEMIQRLGRLLDVGGVTMTRALLRRRIKFMLFSFFKKPRAVMKIYHYINKFL